MRDRLARASAPLLIVGGGGWSEQAARDAQAFAEASSLPVACAFRCQDYLDSRSRSLRRPPDDRTPTRRSRPACATADLLLVVGDRLGDVTTGGYTLVEPPLPRQELIHVYPEARELGRVFAPALAVVSDSAAFLRGDRAGRRRALGGLRARRRAPTTWRGRARRGAVAARPRRWSSARLASGSAGEAIVVNDAGNFSALGQPLPAASPSTAAS